MQIIYSRLSRKKTGGGALNLKQYSGDKGYGIVESLIVLIIISVLVVVVMNRYENIAFEARQAALKTELNNLRQSILLFKMTKGRFPAGLKELMELKFTLPYREGGVISGSYLEPYSVDKEGNLLDPFDIPYVYDSKTGDVTSRKQGFREW